MKGHQDTFLKNFICSTSVAEDGQGKAEEAVNANNHHGIMFLPRELMNINGKKFGCLAEYAVVLSMLVNNNSMK